MSAEQVPSDKLLSLLKVYFGERGHAGRVLNIETWDERDFLYALGSPHAAILCSVLFVPSFIEIEGEVILKHFRAALPDAEMAEGIRNASLVSPTAASEYVRSYNWVEIPDLFEDKSGTGEEYGTLAEMVAEAWRSRLMCCYPDQHFRVRVLNATETGSVIGVGIEQEH